MDKRSSTVTQKTHHSARNTTYWRSFCTQIESNCLKVSADTSFAGDSTARMCQDRTIPYLPWFTAEGADCLAAPSVQHPTRLSKLTQCFSLFHACSMARTSGKIPDNHKLSYLLERHTDQELRDAEHVFQASNKNNAAASGLILRQKVCKAVPPFQKLGNPSGATHTTYSHLHLNGLPASQSALASPLGFVKNKLMAFGTLNGRHRDEADLQYELFQAIPGLQAVDYNKSGRPPKLTQPPAAVLTFKTEEAAAAAFTYRTNAVPLVALHPNQSAGHLSMRKYAEQQISWTDRELAVIRASSPDFVNTSAYSC